MKTHTKKAMLIILTTVIFSSASYAIENQITAISPNSATQGETNLTVTFTLDTDIPPAPPAGVMPNSVTIGDLSITSVTHDSQYTVTAVFDAVSTTAGTKDVTISFSTPQGTTLDFVMAGGFTVISSGDTAPTILKQPQSQTVTLGNSTEFSVEVWGTDSLNYQWYKDDTEIPDATNNSYDISAVDQADSGNYYCEISNNFGSTTSETASLAILTDPPYEGYNLFSPMTSTNTYLMDNDGNFIKTWTSNYRPGLSVYLLEDGTVMRACNTNDTTFNAGGAGGRIEQYDWDGNLIWNYDYSSSDHRQHHDFEVLPNGNILMIAWELKTEAEILAAGGNLTVHTEGELWPDTIIEVEPSGTSGGSIVWEWHAWDHLIQDYDAAKSNYGIIADNPHKINLNYSFDGNKDWNHINSIDYNAERNEILLSVHDFSEIWVIDHSTTTEEAATDSGGQYNLGGSILYRWGNPQTYNRGDSSDQKLFVQHDAEWIDNGDILVFNNGQGRSSGNYSSVDQITPQLNPDGSYSTETSDAFGPSEPTWSYTSTPVTDFYSSRISGSQRLPNGNTLICEGIEGRFFEVTTDGIIVWEYDYDGEIFRVERYAPDYAGFTGTELEPEPLPTMQYRIVDTGQAKCYNDINDITPPTEGSDYYGQDAQFDGNQPSYTITDGGLTITDNVTGLIWTQTADINNDGNIDIYDKFTYTEAIAYPDTLNSQNYAGYNDWRLPTIKELYSLMNFQGGDPSNVTNNDTTGLTPFIDTDYFGFGYGDTDADERIIDAQWASSTLYVSTTMNGNETMFGLNLADGRIKGYPTFNKKFYVYFVRGNTDYGINNFVDNCDGTISDQATGLMWSQIDSGPINGTGPRSGMNWQEALAWVQTKNTENYLGYSDWRLPNAKEMQSIVDYTRSPETTASGAIDPIFNITQITNEAGQSDYPWFWTGTTHATSNGNGGSGAYICFGRAIGYWSNAWQDVHGAGCQRSDRKSGDLSSTSGFIYEPDGYYFENSPQGDSTRINNYVRLVRDTQCQEPGFADYLKGDFNEDCYVNMTDVAYISQKWNSSYSINDLSMIAQNWLECNAQDSQCN